MIKKKEISFDKVADQFELEYETITEGQRSPRWVFGSLGISEVTAGVVEAYRVHTRFCTRRNIRNAFSRLSIVENEIVDFH